MTPSYRRSRALFRKARSLMVGGVSSPVRAFHAVGGEPIFIERAKGPYVWDADGRRYIDFVQSFGAVFLGHAHAGVNRALRRAADRGTVVGAPIREEIDLATRVRGAFPFVEKVRFVNSGTEATMSAVRLARGFTGRSVVVKFSGCYHGHSDGLLAKAGSGTATLSLPDSRGVPASLIRETRVVPYNDVESVKSLFRKEGRRIAAVIVEPIAANMGVVIPKAGFLPALKRISRENGSLLIFDEVITGYRVRFGGAAELYGVAPDLVCMGKIMGGGLPIGAYGGPARIMDQLAPLGPVYQAGTLAGNRAAMATGSEALKVLAGARPYDRLARTTRRFARAIAEAALGHGLAARVNFAPGMLTVFFTRRAVNSFEDTVHVDRALFARFFHAALDRGLSLPPSPFEACFISPVHSDEVLAQAVRKWEKAFHEVGQKSGSSPRMDTNRHE